MYASEYPGASSCSKVQTKQQLKQRGQLHESQYNSTVIIFFLLSLPLVSLFPVSGEIHIITDQKSKLRQVLRALMGKGGGCIFSKKRSTLEPSDQDPVNPVSDHPPNQTSSTVGNGLLQEPKKFKVFIVFYSMYGHVECLAKRMKKGVDSVDGVAGYLYRVPETLSMDVLEQMRVPEKEDELPVISVDELVEADGLLFGFPTRFGSMASQMKAFFDSTGRLWEQQRLAGVPAGFFVSTGTQGGGQETTAWTAITQLAHHGMLYVPIGYTFGAGMFKLDSIRGGSPYGSGVYSGDGTREPSEIELALAEHQGKYMAAMVKRFAPPRSYMPSDSLNN